MGVQEQKTTQLNTGCQEADLYGELKVPPGRGLALATAYTAYDSCEFSAIRRSRSKPYDLTAGGSEFSKQQ